MKLTLPLIPADKANHIVYGIIIYMAFGAFFAVFNLSFTPIVPVILIGALKELYDTTHKEHTADARDFICTVLGGFICAICSIYSL